MRTGEEFELAGGSHLLGQGACIEAQLLVISEHLCQILLKTRTIVLRIGSREIEE